MSDKPKGKASGMPVKDHLLSNTGSESSLIPKMSRTPTAGSHVEKFAAYGYHIFECVACILVCKVHSKVALCKLGRDKGLWLPVSPVKDSESWQSTMVERLKVILGKQEQLTFSPPTVFQMHKIQVPNIGKWVTRVIFKSVLDSTTDKSVAQCCQSNPLVNWIDYTEFKNMQGVWGNEPLAFFEPGLVEKGTYFESNLKDPVKLIPKDNPKNIYEELINMSGILERDIIRLYSEYLQHTYPAQFMSCFSFSEYLRKIGWTSTKEEMASIFRSFLFMSTTANSVNFHEFLLGLAAMEKQISHEGNIGQLRMGYIFRHYDVNGDKKLDHSEMKSLTMDLLKIKGPQVDESILEKELIKCYKAMGLNPVIQ